MTEGFFDELREVFLVRLEGEDWVDSTMRS